MKDSKDITNCEKGCRVAHDVTNIMQGRDAELPMDESALLELYANMSNEEYLKYGCQSFIRPQKELQAEVLRTKLIARKRKQSLRRLVISVTSASIAAALIISFILIDDKPLVPTVLVTDDVSVPTLYVGNEVAINLTDSISESSVVSNNTEENRLTHTSQNKKKKAIKINTLVIPSKYTYSIILSDQTEVFLNAGSKLIYPEEFSGDTREVTFSGEGYFKVAKSNHPFIVHTDSSDIRVYGTEFNVNTYKKGIVETLLVKGSVGQIEPNGRVTMLHPNQLLIFNTQTKNATLKDVDCVNYLSWRSGYFNFVDRSLGEFLDEIAAWYGVKINYPLSLNEIVISIYIEREDDIDRLLRVIKLISGVEIVKDEIADEYNVM